MLEVSLEKGRLATGVARGFLLHQTATEIVRSEFDAPIQLVPVHLEESHTVRGGNKDFII